MRTLVLIVALLAGLKVWSQDHAYRTATEAALVRAYQNQAVARCAARRDAMRRATSLASTKIEIGNPSADVAFWDWQNPLWSVRFRHPHLVLTEPRAGGTANEKICRYDLVRGKASIHQL